MSPLKPENATSPEDYLEQIDEPRREEIEALDRLIRETAPGLERHIAHGMLAYGRRISLASQKRHISLYVGADPDGSYPGDRYRERLPKADIGKSCVRFKRLADVDVDALQELVAGATEPT